MSGIDRARENRLTLEKLKQTMLDKGVERLFFKILGTNNNSKQQIYLGGDFSAISIIPTGDFVSSESGSKKPAIKEGSRKLIGAVNLSWIDSDGALSHAPYSKLILYPQYPEVRFSGFLRGSPDGPSDLLSYEKRGNEDGRVLFLGIANEGKVIAYTSSPEAVITKEIRASDKWECKGVLCEIPLDSVLLNSAARKIRLLTELSRIHGSGWITGKRLNNEGNILSCNASNCGGYTLEAELGVRPNGYSEPDFLGWEVKQYAVKDHAKINNGRITLMTPEPDGGYYVENDLMSFMKKYGYLKDDKYNFNGYHKYSTRQEKTGLLLGTLGFDTKSGKITDADGCLFLADSEANFAASWSFAKLLDHWKIKHAEAVYVPTLTKKNGDRSYYFGDTVKLGTGTNFEKFLKSMVSQMIIYDPGSRIRNVSTKPEPKKRNQFRMAVKDLSRLYTSFEEVSVKVVP